MNFFQKLTGLFAKSFWVQRSTMLLGNEPTSAKSEDFLDAYETSFLVHSCIRKIAERVASIDFQLFKVVGVAGREKVQEIKDHQLLDLLEKVNSFNTRTELISDTVTYLKLLGNAYWLKVRSGRSNKPIELWCLRPDWVKIVSDPDKFIKHYEYTLPNGNKEIIPVEDIIHFKTTNPRSSLIGMPVIKPVMDIVRSSVFASRWNTKFFYNYARPDALLVSKTKISPEGKEELRRQWNVEYGGIEGAHKLGILEGEVEYKPLNLTMRDMDFVNLTNTTRDQILAAFGVPKTLLGFTEDVNRATAESAVYVFLSEVIEPEMKRIVDKLNEFLVPDFGDNIHLSFKDPTPENRKATIEEYAAALAGNWMVINEVRDREGLPPIDGGWDFYLPVSMVSAGQAEQKSLKTGSVDPKQYYKNKEDKKQEELMQKVFVGKKDLKLKLKLKSELMKAISGQMSERQKLQMNEEQKRAYWAEHEKSMTSDERMFMVLVRRLLKDQEQRIQDAVVSELTGVAGNKTIAKHITKILDEVNWDIENTVFAKVSLPVFSDIVTRRGARAARLTGTTFTHTDRVTRYIDRKTVKFADRVNTTTRKSLREALSEGVRAGESVPQLSKRVQELFKSRRGWETERIARTEVLSASNHASMESYRQSGVVEKKEWLATPDERTRPNHWAINGEVVGLNERFSNGLRYPGDMMGSPEDIINCRCTTIPVIAER